MTDLSNTQARALSIAVDELLSYAETIEESGEDEPKVRWAIRHIDAMLEASGHPELKSQP